MADGKLGFLLFGCPGNTLAPTSNCLLPAVLELEGLATASAEWGFPFRVWLEEVTPLPAWRAFISIPVAK